MFKQIFITIAAMTLSSVAFQACSSTNPQNSLASHKSWKTLQSQMKKGKLSADFFSTRGPYQFEREENYTIRVNRRTLLETDLFTSAHEGKAPLVIFVHGNKFNKDVHKKQAEHLASWGFHSLTVEVPNEDQWIQNGTRIANLVKLVYRSPSILSSRIDTKRIILVGHSFGGSAITIATGKGAPAAGLILLDPAVVHSSVIQHMRKVSVPTVLLGADKKIFRSRKRAKFFDNIKGPMFRLSVVGATHNDAQFPSINEVRWGFDFSTDREKQETFLSSIVASVHALTSREPMEMAWRLFQTPLKQKKIKKAHFRGAKI